MYDINMIAAVSKNGVIAREGKIPWNLSDDLQNFKRETRDHVVVQGMNTFRSIFAKFGHPLKNRTNVILTRNKHFKFNGCCVRWTPEDILQEFRNQKIYIIGGGEIYRLFLPYTGRLLITEVDVVVEGEELVYFPEIKMSDGWKSKIVLTHRADEKNDFDFTIVEHTRRPPPRP